MRKGAKAKEGGPPQITVRRLGGGSGVRPPRQVPPPGDAGCEMSSAVNPSPPDDGRARPSGADDDRVAPTAAEV